jgi:multicomponent Na+:H+ antiporter subunit F
MVDPVFLNVIMLAVLGCGLLCLVRAAAGPTAADRIAALNALGMVAVGFCALMALHFGQAFYMNVALCWAVISLVGSLALAKYLEGKQFDE